MNKLFAAVHELLVAHSVAFNPSRRGLLIGREADINAAAR
jgi:hypothetical protein